MLSNPDWEKKQLLDLSKPSLETLSHILRHKDLWPKNFTWDFGSCQHCAMGLAHKLWPESIKRPISHEVGHAIGISYDAAYNIFLGKAFPLFSITPELVADELDKLTT